MRSVVARLFTPDDRRYEGVRPIQIYACRLGCVLIITLLGYRSWSLLLQHQGDWDPIVAAALSMWAGFSLLAVFALINPLRWLPIFLFEIAFKIIWLAVVAVPLWRKGQLSGSPAEELTFAFLPVIFPIVAMPWGYVWRIYVRPVRRRLART
jgi:hypothetical protein